mgnify:CR=1 FL=1
MTSVKVCVKLQNDHISLGNHEITYAHQVIVDTGKNKPFELRPVKFSVVYIGPNFPGDIDGYKANVLDGDFAGTECSGDTLKDVVFEVQYVLMDKSRTSFGK